MTTPFQHVVPFEKRSEEEIARLNSMTEEERRADYFKRKRKREIRNFIVAGIPFFLLSLIGFGVIIIFVLGMSKCV